MSKTMLSVQVLVLCATTCTWVVSGVGVGCGTGTTLDPDTNLCVVQGLREKRDLSEPRIISEEGTMLLTVDQNQKVGVRVGDEDQPTQYLETSNSTVGAVVAAMKLGYEMNREINQIKDMQKLKEDLQKEIADSKTESATKREELRSESATKREELRSDIVGSVNVINNSIIQRIDAADSKLNDELSTAITSLKYDTNRTLAANTAVVQGLQNSVPKGFCNDQVKNNGESDVDCGGPCGPCAKGKKCQFSSDCDASVCVAGTCKTCSQGDGDVSVSPGRIAYCKEGLLVPSKSQTNIIFDSCGKTGEFPPIKDDCVLRKSLKSDFHSLTADVTYIAGSQVFVAPIDGIYTWTLYGAAGGADITCCGSNNQLTSYDRRGKGGEGGKVTVKQNGVKAGTVFYINVGQQGYDCFDTNDGMHDPGSQKYHHCVYNPSGYSGWDNGKPWYDPDAKHAGFNACGGFNGGGPAICNHNIGGASGGGATDVRMCKNGGDCDTLPGLDDRFVVAGGGGGGSCEGNNPHGCDSNARYGGHGGSTTGENGMSNGLSGYGGSQSAGGKGQSGNNRDQGNSFGSKGQGGTGGRNDGGGGGGGYYGGGGAHHNSGGGGGSSFVGGTTVSGKLGVVTNSRGGNRNRDGYVLLQIKG